MLFTKATASQIDIIEGMSNVICKVKLPTTHYSHLSWIRHIISVLCLSKNVSDSEV